MTQRSRRPARLLAFASPLLLAACGDGGTGPDPPDDGPGELDAEVVASGLSSPLHLTAPPGDPRLFVVEQPGRIRIVRDGQLLEEPFLDITDRVRSGGERGLLSVAFPPDYADNGHFYVDYTAEADEGGTRVERYTVSASDPDSADPTPDQLILSVDQPFTNHNGGQLAFGPDGMLYVGLGDGGGAGDPEGNGQDPSTLLGSLLRLDVDPTTSEPYTIPPDNPFVGREGRDEIWAWGLRNPWRYAFDPVDGLLYIADVGQNDWEEVNAVAADSGGVNYGWNVLEGESCFEPPEDCDRTGLTEPVLVYENNGNCSVTGGRVYRGDAVPELRGHYVYADLCAGWVRSFRLSDGEVTDEREWPLGDLGSILSFGEDADGELYVLSSDGNVYRLVAP
jgi:glucose/arabinose dehydrogenase